DFIQSETFAGVAYPTFHHVTSAEIGNLNLLVGIEPSSMLNRINQHFAKGHSNRASFRLRQVRDLIEKLYYPICCLKVTTRIDADPFRSRRNDVDPIIPGRFLDCALDH